MFCIKCGKEIDDESRFCPFCGAENPSMNQEISNISQPGDKKPKKKMALIKKILIGIGIILVLFILFIMIVGGDSEDSEKKTTKATTEATTKSTTKATTAATTKATTEAVTEAKKDTYVLPISNKRRIIDNDLEPLSEKELRIARNEIMARHGRKFKDAELQEYFNSCSWYKGTVEPDDFDESVLSDVERYNVNSISEWENFKEEAKNPEWYKTYNNFEDSDTGKKLEVIFLDDGTLQLAIDGITLYETDKNKLQRVDSGLTYECEDGSSFSFYPEHHHEINLQTIDGENDGVYYPN